METRLLLERVESSYARELSYPNGFLPRLVPADDLPLPFIPYLEACDLLPRLLADEGAKAWLGERFARFDDDLLVPELDRLSELHRNKLLTVLSYLGHGYRWDRIPAVTNDFHLTALDLPRGIDVPWRYLSKLNGQPRSGTLWSMFHSNWRLQGKPGGSPYQHHELVWEAMEVQHNFLGPPLDRQLSAFVLSFVLTEARGVAIVRSLIDTMHAVESGDDDRVLHHLTELHEAILAMNQVFFRMIRKEVVDTETWLDYVQRPYVWGVEDDDGIRREGPSGMQLGVMDCLNTALNIESQSELAGTIRNSRVYLPAQHRQFLQLFDRTRPIISSFVASTENRNIKEMFNSCLNALMAWRRSHHKRGAEYFKGRPGSAGMQASTGLVISQGENLLTVFERQMEERIIETQRSKVIINKAEYTAEDFEYLEAVKFFLGSDGRMSAEGTRLLLRLRSKLGISEARAAELERDPDVKNNFKLNELEYMDHVEFFLAEDGTIDGTARVNLSLLREALAIQPARATVLESFVHSQILHLTEEDLEYMNKVVFCLEHDDYISADERRILKWAATRLGIPEERAHQLEDMCMISHREQKKSLGTNAICSHCAAPVTSLVVPAYTKSRKSLRMRRASRGG